MLEIVQVVGALIRRFRRVPDPSLERGLDHGELSAEDMAAAPGVSFEDLYGRRIPDSEYAEDDRLEWDGEA